MSRRELEPFFDIYPARICHFRPLPATHSRQSLHQRSKNASIRPPCPPLPASRPIIRLIFRHIALNRFSGSSHTKPEQKQARPGSICPPSARASARIAPAAAIPMHRKHRVLNRPRLPIRTMPPAFQKSADYVGAAIAEEREPIIAPFGCSIEE